MAVTLARPCPTAAVADACMRNGVALRVAPSGLRPVRRQAVAGPARPVRHYGSVDVFLEAIDRASPGEVLVIDNDGRSDEGCIGDLVALEAEAAGLAAVLCWGAIRDRDELERLAIPVFGYGTMPLGPRSVRPRDADALEWARIGEAIVTHRDFVFADDDGAVFVAASEISRVIETAGQIAAAEKAQAIRVREGCSLRQQFELDDYLRRRAISPSYSFREHLAARKKAIEA